MNTDKDIFTTSYKDTRGGRSFVRIGIVSPKYFGADRATRKAPCSPSYLNLGAGPIPSLPKGAYHPLFGGRTEFALFLVL